MNGILHDLINFLDYETPLEKIWVPKKFEINLLTGEINGDYENDSLTDFFGKKRNWFIERIKKLGGKISDFEEAKISVQGAGEIIRMKYKGKEYSYERVW